MKDLIPFLLEAKRNTYASGGEEAERRLPDGSREFIFKKEDWKYQDRYVGFDPFGGQEIVWKKDEIVWTMIYYGHTITTITSAKETHLFLKKSLQQVSTKSPFRGPNHFQEGEFEYQNKFKGNFEDFEGEELILYRGKEVYLLGYRSELVL